MGGHGILENVSLILTYISTKNITQDSYPCLNKRGFYFMATDEGVLYMERMKTKMRNMSTR